MKNHTEVYPSNAWKAPIAWRRLWRLSLGELHFAAKYGILLLYAVLSILYLLMMYWTPADVRPVAGGVIILTDPAAMGLFFMGAMVLLEKSQRVNCALAVSPVRVEEYIAAKALALMGVGLLVGLVVGWAANVSLLGVALSVLLSSLLFTMLGMMIACVSNSLNLFLVLSIPVELVAFVPAMLYWFGVVHSPLWLLFPGVAGIVLLGAETALWLPAVLSLLAWNLLIFPFCRRVVASYFAKLGGGTL